MSLNPGHRFGPYEVVARIGADRIGDWYRGTDVNSGGSVVLRALPETFAGDPEGRARVEQEVARLVGLKHPNIAAIRGVEKSHDTWVLVTELLEGPTLADRIARGPIPLDEALPIARQIAEALVAAHAEGIGHGDLTPANISVRPDGTVTVMSFGVAKVLQPAAAEGVDTAPSESAVGTAAYLSFEQTIRRRVDARADVWTFGAVLYEMVTGRRAFGGADLPATLMAVRRARPDWDVLPHELPRPLRALIEACLQRAPAKRIAARDLIRDLSKIEPSRTLGKLPEIFISYVDDDKQWITRLHDALAVRLRQLLGFEVRIWKDPAVADADEGFRIRRDPRTSGKDQIPLKAMAALHDAVAFLCLVSPAYLRSGRCRQEVHEYVVSRRPGQDRHVFKLIVSPTALEAPSQPIADVLAYEFFVTDPVTGRTRELNEIFGPDAQREFWVRLDDLAHDLASVIRSAQPISRKRDEEFSFMPEVPGMFSIAEPGAGTRQLRVFLCYASDDKTEVRALYESLVRIGVEAWLDEAKLIPGQLWETEIRQAVKRSDAVVVCLSKKSQTKTSFVQEEIRYALDVADEYPRDALYLIPAKLEECEVPEGRLSRRHWVNLFDESGPRRLAETLHARAVQLSVLGPTPRG